MSTLTSSSACLIAHLRNIVEAILSWRRKLSHNSLHPIFTTHKTRLRVTEYAKTGVLFYAGFFSLNENQIKTLLVYIILDTSVVLGYELFSSLSLQYVIRSLSLLLLISSANEVCCVLIFYNQGKIDYALVRILGKIYFWALELNEFD